MGALYVKDDEALRMAEQLAGQRGLTKVAAVKLALANELDRTPPARPAREIAAELRRTSTLKFTDAVVNTKAFYDSLHDEEGD